MWVEVRVRKRGKNQRKNSHQVQMKMSISLQSLVCRRRRHRHCLCVLLFLYFSSFYLDFLISSKHMARAVHIILKTTWHTTRITHPVHRIQKNMPNGILMMLTIDFPNNHFARFFFTSQTLLVYIICLRRRIPPHANRTERRGAFRTPLRTYVHENLITENIKLTAEKKTITETNK